LRIRDCPFLFGWSGDRGVMVGLRLRDIGARRCRVVRRLVERLLGGGIAAVR
jgi:hypothetical protein